MSTRLPVRARAPHLPINEQMREARHAAGLTQAVVAKRLFVARTTVKCWEAGLRTPHVDMLDAYLRAVGGTITLGVTR